jgi:hypothetical protein
MKKIIIILIMGCLFGQVSAQVSYFVRPTFDNKLYFCNANSLFDFHVLDYSFEHKEFLGNQYFNPINVKVTQRDFYSFGIYFGVALQNKKHLIEFGINQDATGSEFECEFMDYDFYTYKDTLYKHYSPNRMIFASYLPTLRYHLQYSIRLINGSNSKVLPYLIIGGGVIHNLAFPRKDEFTNLDDANQAYSYSLFGKSYLEENVYISQMKNYGYTAKKFSGYLNLGLTTDFFTKKGFNLFSASIFFLKGFNPIEMMYSDVYVVDNMENKVFSYLTTSNGSGLYLQLSRKFQLYPWLWRIRKH